MIFEDIGSRCWRAGLRRQADGFNLGLLLDEDGWDTGCDCGFLVRILGVTFAVKMCGKVEVVIKHSREPIAF